jgi:3-deoxy-manno-octulosonate cytidylyltransferase (CMP-KDO synthetase)
VTETSSPTIAIVIPARYGSTRYPGKPMAAIRGATGIAKSLLQRSIEAAGKVRSAAAVYVATDDPRIADMADELGVTSVMTPESCANGTERVAAARANLPAGIDIFVNFQGDALLTPPAFVEALIAHMSAHPECPVATVAVRCSTGTYEHLAMDAAHGRVGGTTVVLNGKGEAMLFSKRMLPYIAPTHIFDGAPPTLLHLGLYAYRTEALNQYVRVPETEIERLEGLEQLRFLYHGVPVAVIVCDPPAWDMIELNNPSDLAPIEAILAAQGWI